ncbi:MAG: hypothetical protein ACYC5O_16260 [Anaerolineae bacterium]
MSACGARPGISEVNDASPFPYTDPVTRVMVWTAQKPLAPGITDFNDASPFPYTDPVTRVMAWTAQKPLAPGITDFNDYDWHRAS